MKEIKFRVYEPIRNEMLYDNFVYANGSLYQFIEFGIGSGEEYESENCILIDRLSPLITHAGEKPKPIIMQYTGLKSNEREIYEGDILGLESHQDFFVDFHDGCFVAKSTNKVQRINWLPSALWELIGMGYEVIGNIYENPKLLNE